MKQQSLLAMPCESNAITKRITFGKVVSWLTDKGLPRIEAEKVCRASVKDGLTLLGKINRFDREKQKVGNSISLFK